MLAVILFWVYITVVLYGLGLGTILFINCLLRQESPIRLSSMLVWLSGLMTATTIAVLFSLITKLGLAVSLLLLLLSGMGWYWAFKKEKSLLPRIPHPPALVIILGSMVILTVLINAIRQPSNPDTGIYHAQAIHWMESYPAIPGLGNLHSRLAYDSSWLTVNAVTSFSFLGLGSLHILPSALFLAACLYFLYGLINILNGQTQPSNLLRILLLPIAFEILGAEISSPGTDMPAAILVWILFIEWMRIFEENDNITPLGLPSVILTLLSILTITIKLSTLPILLLPAIVWMRAIWKGQIREALILAVLCIVILAPWLARNVILSGYLVFPLPEIDLFTVDWKIPPKVAADERVSIWAFAVDSHSRPGMVLSRTMQQNTRIWISELTNNRKVILLLALLSPLSLLLCQVFNQKEFSRLKKYGLVYTTSFVGMIYWFFSAPTYRFGTGFIIFSLLLTLLPWIDQFLQLKQILYKAVVIIAILLTLYQGSVFYRTFDRSIIVRQAILPADYVHLPTHPCTFYNFKIACADQYNECWYEPFPCVPRPIVEVGQRGKSLQEGFKYYLVP